MGGEAKGVNSTLFSKVLWGQQAINYCVCVWGGAEWSCVGWEVYRTDFCWDRVSAILPKPIGF